MEFRCPPRSYQPGVPKAHYLLTYFSHLDQREKEILLDVLNEDHGYPALMQAQVVNEWILTNGEAVSVSIPTPESITGDKLTAFAPNTTGIRFRVEIDGGRIVEKQMEVMKQLFDIGILFDQVTNQLHLTQSFKNISQKEIIYRALDGLTPDHVLADIIDTSLMIASLGKIDPNGHFPHVNNGLARLNSYIYNGAFRIDEAVLASSKAAYLAAIIQNGYAGEIQRWNGGDDIQKYFISPVEYQFLNKRRNILGAPLFYWHHALSLSGRI